MYSITMPCEKKKSAGATISFLSVIVTLHLNSMVGDLRIMYHFMIFQNSPSDRPTSLQQIILIDSSDA